MVQFVLSTLCIMKSEATTIIIHYLNTSTIYKQRPLYHQRHLNEAFLACVEYFGVVQSHDVMQMFRKVKLHAAYRHCQNKIFYLQMVSSQKKENCNLQCKLM